jgi:hypothetical protein
MKKKKLLPIEKEFILLTKNINKKLEIARLALLEANALAQSKGHILVDFEYSFDNERWGLPPDFELPEIKVDGIKEAFNKVGWSSSHC